MTTVAQPAMPQFSQQTFTDSIIEAMCAELTNRHLDVLKLYPDDLLKHDRHLLERHAYPGAKIAWMCGQLHSHLTVIGIHPEENMSTTYLTKLASDDLFFVIDIAPQQIDFSIIEISREEFHQLHETPIPYVMQDGPFEFWLSLYNRDRVGHVRIEDCIDAGNSARRTFKAVITPTRRASGLDCSALRLWAKHACACIANNSEFALNYIMEEPVKAVSL